MVGIASATTGVVLFPEPKNTDKFTLYKCIDGSKQDTAYFPQLYSTVYDWEQIEGSNIENVLKTARDKYWVERSVSLILFTLEGLEETLTLEILEHVQEIFTKNQHYIDKTLDILLVAPLKQTTSAVSLSKLALSKGFPVIASLIDQLVELQPKIQGLTDAWLSIEEEEFGSLSETRQQIWTRVVKNCNLQQLLNATNLSEFSNNWNITAYHFHTPKSRSALSRLGKILSSKLYSVYDTERVDLIESHEDYPSDEEELKLQTERAEKVLERVNKQIITICKHVSKGEDYKANKYLQELIEEQTSYIDGEGYVVKSLCNIAQRSADMFRVNFESICLEKALSIKPDDVWTIIQKADHLKRIGKYNDAISILENLNIGDNSQTSDVILSSIADVYSHQGKYDLAINKYKEIKHDMEVQLATNAIADNLRRKGDYPESRKLYQSILSKIKEGNIDDYDSGIRAQAGLAEIYKHEGNADQSIKLYKELINTYSLKEGDKPFYMMGYCNVLKMNEEYFTAYEIADDIVREYPFFRQASFMRASISGLIGKELEGLKDLPEIIDTPSHKKWINNYYRGLLLLGLNRFEDARINLVEEFSKTLASGEDKEILRMGAAVWYLKSNEIEEADKLLLSVGDLYDYHIQYLSLVLNLHTAKIKNDQNKVLSITKAINKYKIKDVNLEKAIDAIKNNNFTSAVEFETKALLKIAA